MATDEVGPGSLKLVCAYSPSRPLRTLIDAVLRRHIAEHDIRHLFGRVFIVHCDAEPQILRDWLAPELLEGESAFVVEFERWSAWGRAIDARWLLLRGH